jgi:hypothetical protein
MIQTRPSAPPATKTSILGIETVPVNPTNDPGLGEAFRYRQQHVYPFLAKQGFQILRCQATGATRDCAKAKDIEPGVAFMTGVGHGVATAFRGYRSYVFVKSFYKKEEVKGKIVHLLACDIGKELGPDMVKNGCLAFFGYDAIYDFPPGRFAGLFLGCDADIDQAIASGLSARQVYRRVKLLYTRRVCDLYGLGRVYYAAMLKTNRNHLRRLGDARARLVKTRARKRYLVTAGG